MVQTAQSCLADHWTGRPRTDSAARSFFAEAKMRAIVMIIRHVLLAEHRTAKSILVNVYPEVMIAQMATTLSPSPRTRLTPVDIDRLAAEFLELESKVDELYKLAVTADEPHERMREQLIDLVEEFGRHSERSKLLQGITHEIGTTFGVSTSIELLRQTRSRMC
jgi:hypothetical protein